ncbi:ATP-binding protein [Planktothrix mougeotii]|uniref:ATP-binding protein n=1 Tax=Planktothrix mougeotii TaxID=54306 RepID=UPI002AD2C898|nr:ATP-binding protein [Planktothrix mougeotii]
MSIPYLWENQTGGDLGLESTLEDLPLYDFQVVLGCSVRDLVQHFERHPLLPGVIIVDPKENDTSEFLGMISRRGLLEFFLRPKGLELFLDQSLDVVYSYIRTPVLVLPAQTSILTATQQSLKRSAPGYADPIVVQGNWLASADYPWMVPYRLLNSHELNLAYWQIRGIETQVRYERTQVQLLQSEKMASLGRLVDGVAHEILDPVGFIWGNLTHLITYSDSLIELLDAYATHYPQPVVAIEALKEEIEFDFLRQDFPRLLSSIKSGTERLSKLATSLQNFCHIDEIHPKPADIHSHLDSILLLMKSRINRDIKIIKNYGHLPPITCYIGQLNQVFINVLIHGFDSLLNQAIKQDWVDEYGNTQGIEPSELPQIIITTGMINLDSSSTDQVNAPERWVSICIADNSPGLSAEEQQKILDSFSNPKRPQKETSLSLSYHIVTAKHGGQLKLRSQPGIGTEFEILLPFI